MKPPLRQGALPRGGGCTSDKCLLGSQLLEEEGDGSAVEVRKGSSWGCLALGCEDLAPDLGEQISQNTATIK